MFGEEPETYAVTAAFLFVLILSIPPRENCQMNAAT